MRWLVLCAFGCALGFGGMAGAQTSPRQDTILIIDSDLLYERSRYGQLLRQSLVEERQALEAENQRLVDTLRAEELRLAEDRKVMSAQDFAAAAAEFDARVETTRNAQDAKAAAADRKLARQRDVFERRVRPIVSQIMFERGASMILESSTDIYLALQAVEITREAIARVDDTLVPTLDQDP